MTRYQLFVLVSAIIFVFERILPVIINWPIFIFPTFIIFFMLNGKDISRDLPYVAVASLFFDFFSGYSIGFFTLSIMAICLVIFLFKSHFSVNTDSILSPITYTFLFSFGYVAVFLFKSSPRLVLAYIFPLILEIAILLAIFFGIFRIVLRRNF